jgi:hypothetical protein
MGPYNATGNLWQPCDVDVCNGVIMNGKYVYVTTLFHPYTVGCWGPGYPKQFLTSCTSKALICTSGMTLQNSLFIMSVVLITFFSLLIIY